MVNNDFLEVFVFSQNVTKILIKGASLWQNPNPDFLIQDHSDHGASKELRNPYPEWIRRFLSDTP